MPMCRWSTARVWVVLCIALFALASPARAQDPSLTPLCAPYALYPDPLLAQVLAASTYPDQVSDAAQWCSANPGLRGSDLATAVAAQPWDGSVKALCTFPDVLAAMALHLDATTSLGQYFLADKGSVMDCVQNLRAKAQTMGALASTPQQQVNTTNDVIVIQPANPDVVYVPTYNPDYLYGTAYPPGAGWLAFGAGVALGAAFNDNYGAFDWAAHGMYCGAAVRTGYYAGGYRYAGVNAWTHNVYGGGGYHAGYVGGYGSVEHAGVTGVYHGPEGGTGVYHAGATDFHGYGGAGDFSAAHVGAFGGGYGGGFDSRAAGRGYASMGGSAFHAGGFSGGCAHFGGGFRR